MTTIAVERVITPMDVRTPATVEVRGTLIDAVRPATGAVEPWTLIPGLVDLQVNGIDGIDVWSADGSDWDHLDAALAKQGVTAWLPTLTSGHLADYRRALEAITAATRRDGRGRPAILGAHLEGPFLGHRTGAHDDAAVIAVDLDWLRDLPDIVKVVTVGPERDGALDAIAALSATDVVVALGHTDADAATMTAAVDAGASMVTHLYNAMGPFHHRAPGAVGVALTDHRLTASLIADGTHVDPVAIRLAFAAKGPGRVVLVSDQVAGVDDAGAVRLGDGTLAGATASLADGVRTVVTRCGVPLDIAVHAASTTPAALIGDGSRGRVEAGARADLVALDSDLRVAAVWIGGDPVSLG
jgi:N-acetylglucosamine-6-phosphate deacetylase